MRSRNISQLCQCSITRKLQISKISKLQIRKTSSVHIYSGDFLAKALRADIIFVSRHPQAGSFRRMCTKSNLPLGFLSNHHPLIEITTTRDSSQSHHFGEFSGVDLNDRYFLSLLIPVF